MNEYKYKIKGVDYDVKIVDIEGNIAKVEVNGVPFDVEMEKSMSRPVPIARPAAPAPRPAAPAPAAPAARPAAAAPAAAAPAAAAPAAGGAAFAVKAPLPGTINDVKVAVGQEVKKGQTVVVLEAMKMENNIDAERDGKIAEVRVQKGDAVMEGAVLVTIA